MAGQVGAHESIQEQRANTSDVRLSAVEVTSHPEGHRQPAGCEEIRPWHGHADAVTADGKVRRRETWMSAYRTFALHYNAQQTVNLVTGRQTLRVASS